LTINPQAKICVMGVLTAFYSFTDCGNLKMIDILISYHKHHWPLSEGSIELHANNHTFANSNAPMIAI